MCLIFTKRTLVLKVQLCTTLRVQSSEHLDEDILQDCRTCADTHRCGGDENGGAVWQVITWQTKSVCMLTHIHAIFALPSSGLSSRLMRMRNGLRSCMRTLSSSPPRALPCKIPTIACKTQRQAHSSITVNVTEHCSQEPFLQRAGKEPITFYYFVKKFHIYNKSLSPLSFFWLRVFLRFVCHIIGWSLEQTVSVVPTFSPWTELQYLSQSRWPNHKHRNKTKNIFKKCLKNKTSISGHSALFFHCNPWRTGAHHLPGDHWQFGVWQGKLQSVCKCKSLWETRGVVFKGESTGNKRVNIKKNTNSNETGGMGTRD